MSKVVNLNKFRKQQVAKQRVKQADTNRRLHGRTKAERARDALQKRSLSARVDQARLDPTPEPSDNDAVGGVSAGAEASEKADGEAQ